MVLALLLADAHAMPIKATCLALIPRAMPIGRPGQCRGRSNSRTARPCRLGSVLIGGVSTNRVIRFTR